jgi:hypothetical protein
MNNRRETANGVRLTSMAVKQALEQSPILCRNAGDGGLFLPTSSTTEKKGEQELPVGATLLIEATVMQPSGQGRLAEETVRREDRDDPH